MTGTPELGFGMGRSRLTDTRTPQRMHRRTWLPLLLIAAGGFVACNPLAGTDPEFDLCLDGPCGARSPQMPEYVVLGFPPALVDRDAQAMGGGLVIRLETGDTVPLHFVRVPAAGVPLMQAPDTLRNAAWSTTGTAATLTVGADGVARLAAVRPGVATLLVNGSSWPMYACGAAPTDACYHVGEISVE